MNTNDQIITLRDFSILSFVFLETSGILSDKVFILHEDGEGNTDLQVVVDTQEKAVFGGAQSATSLGGGIWIRVGFVASAEGSVCVLSIAEEVVGNECVVDSVRIRLDGSFVIGNVEVDLYLQDFVVLSRSVSVNQFSHAVYRFFRIKVVF